MSSAVRTARGSTKSHPIHLPTLRPCATRCAPRVRAGMVFAKNSDRPPGEIQIAWPFGRRASAGCTLRTQYLSIGDTGAHATFLSCPTWLWGAEHGVNEHGVAIGNERVSTTHDAASAKPALIGMDLVRLGLERARTAAEAVDVMTGLLETCGQGGIADAAHQEAYDSSFLIADPSEAFVLETAGADYAVAPFAAGVAISNRITLGTEWTRASAGLAPGDDFDRFRDHGEDTAYADVRLAASRRFLASTPPGGLTPAATAAHLRDHGTGPWGAPGRDGPVHVPPRPRRGGRPRRQRLHARPRPERHRGVHDRRAAGRPRRRGAAARLRGGGQPVRQHLRAGLPAHGRRPAAVRPPRALRRGAVARRRRAAPAGRGRPRPRCRRSARRSTPVEDELWAEADDVAEDPARWADVGASWGAPGPRRAAVLHPLISPGRGDTLRSHASVCSYSPRGMS